MANYRKWLGAGFGSLIGGPIGGMLGFIVGSAMDQTEELNDPALITKEISEFEVNLIVLASHLIKIDGKIARAEVSFLNAFLNSYFNPAFSIERTHIIEHCLAQDYDLDAACHSIRTHTPHATRIQIVHLLFDIAMSDGTFSDREGYFIFRISGYLNINDIDFKKIQTEHLIQNPSVYDLLGVRSTASMSEVRTAYRKLVLKYHPDRNKDASEREKKRLSEKFQQIQEAYEKIKSEREKVKTI